MRGIWSNVSRSHTSTPSSSLLGLAAGFPADPAPPPPLLPLRRLARHRSLQAAARCFTAAALSDLTHVQRSMRHGTAHGEWVVNASSSSDANELFQGQPASTRKTHSRDVLVGIGVQGVLHAVAAAHARQERLLSQAHTRTDTPHRESTPRNATVALLAAGS